MVNVITLHRQLPRLRGRNHYVAPHAYTSETSSKGLYSLGGSRCVKAFNKLQTGRPPGSLVVQDRRRWGDIRHGSMAVDPGQINLVGGVLDWKLLCGNELHREYKDIDRTVTVPKTQGVSNFKMVLCFSWTPRSKTSIPLDIRRTYKKGNVAPFGV